jgi:hypothetical protein
MLQESGNAVLQESGNEVLSFEPQTNKNGGCPGLTGFVASGFLSLNTTTAEPTASGTKR